MATNTYDPYGTPAVNNTGRFQYTGQIWLEEVGLYYYKARYYDPDIRRFITTDPIGYGDGMNMYAYVGGDPMNMRDPSGLSRLRRPKIRDCEPTSTGVTCGTGSSGRGRSIYITINPFGGLGPLGTSGTGLEWAGLGGAAGTIVQMASADGDGHEYETSNVICNDSSLLSADQQRAVVSRFAVPRAPGQLVSVPPEGGRYLVQDPRTGIGVPGGLVDSIISNNGFSAINTTVPGRHVFAGSITRNLIDVDGRLVMNTQGVGTAQVFGGIRDSLNQWQGPMIFNTFDQMAASELAIFFPGCKSEEE